MKKALFILLFSVITSNVLNCQVITYIDSNDVILMDTLVFTIVEKMPQFIGGEKARIDYLNKNINYPYVARTSGIEGRVDVSFIVDTDGSISDVKILRGIGGGCDEEAIRLVTGMPLWEPGKQRGKPVKVRFNMPLIFILNNSGQIASPDNDYTKGIELMNEEFYDKAIESFSESIEKKGINYKEAYCTRGVCCYQLGNLEQAAADIYEAFIIRANINNDEVASVLFLIANEYFIRNKLPEAIEMYTGSLQLDAENPRAYFNRGLAYSKSGNSKEAKKDWKKAKSLGYLVPEFTE